MKPTVSLILLTALCLPLHSQTVLEWKLSETGPNPDEDDTPALGGSLDVPIFGDGTNGDADSSALLGRFTPVTLASENDSITFEYEMIIVGGVGPGSPSGGANADFRWGFFNSQGTSFSGDQADLSGWTGTFAFNSGSAISDADIYVRNSGNTERFYVSTGATDITGGSDFANQDFLANGVIYTVSMTITRLAGDVMDITTTLTGDDGYSFTVTGQESVDPEFTFDRVGFWVNALSADRVALKAASAPTSTDGDSIPDLEEIRWFGDLTTADDSSNTDGDDVSDLDEITVTFTDPTDPTDPPAQLPALFVDFNADGTAGQTGPNLETGYLEYTVPHETNSIDDSAGIDVPVFGSTVNLAIDYVDDSGFDSYGPTVKQMIGRSNNAVAAYEGTLGELMRDWIGIDPRTSEGGNGPVGNEFGSPTNLTFTISGLPAGDYQYRAYHHDVSGINGNFDLTITDATRTDVSLGSFQMTTSAPTGGNPVFDVTGNRGTAGVDASTLTYAVGEAPPTGGESRTLYAANIGQAVISGGQLQVFLDDFPALVTGSSNDRTWLQGIGYRSTSGSDISYVDVTLLNTDIVGGGPDTLWADGDDATTGGSVINGSAANDGLWRFRSAQGNGGIWEATGGSAVAEDCVEIVTSVTVPNDTYDVFVFYYPVTGTGDYPVRAGFAPGAPTPGINPGAGNPPSDLSSTITVPFESDGNPVVFTYRVYEEPGDESLSVVGVNGFEITELTGDFRVTSITRTATDVTMTWLSMPDESYDILAGTDLLSFPTLAADDVVSEGGMTTHTFPIPPSLLSEPKVFFVVEENP